jgi:hypothetical protein
LFDLFQPTLSVPIHVVELTNVPPELRVNASASASSPLQQNVDTIEAEKQVITFYNGINVDCNKCNILGKYACLTQTHFLIGFLRQKGS